MSNELFGYEIDDRELPDLVSSTIQRLISREKQFVACANPHSIVVAKGDADFRRALRSANVLLPDGVGVLLASRILGLSHRYRIAGMDYFLSLSEICDKRNAKYFFLGSSELVLNRIQARLAYEFSGIEVAGTFSPPYAAEFSKKDSELMVEKVNSVRPDVLWVGMTAPKQEKWIHENLASIDVPVVCAVGAVFDFYAGTRKRAPEWVCNLGFEWLPRLLREPARLFRRNFVSSPLFLAMVLAEKLRPNRNSRHA